MNQIRGKNNQEKIGILAKAGILNLSATHMWGWNILCYGDYPVHERVFSSIPDPLDASSIPSPTTWTELSLDLAKCPSGERNCSQLKTTGLTNQHQVL